VLTDKKCENARPGEKPYKLTDYDGLSLLVKPVSKRNPKGIKLWRFRYKFNGTDQMLSFGKYPAVSLAQAREKSMAERCLIAKSINPSDARKKAKQEKRNTFAALGQDFFDRGCPYGKNRKLKQVTVDQLQRRYDEYLKPSLESKVVADITVTDIRRILDRIVADDKTETAHRVRALAERVFRLAIVCGLIDNNPAAALLGTLPARDTTHFAAVTDIEAIGPLLRAIDGYDGTPEVAYALKMAPHVFVRPGELRGGRWSEIDWDHKEWVIPAERMKMNREHVVPMSRQVIALLKQLRPITEARDWLFPSLRSDDRPISDNALNAALRRMGYSKEQMTAHGFRSLASTRLHEMRKGDEPLFDSAVIEFQMAHMDANAVRATYNRHDARKHLAARRKMMQHWSDFLDRVKADEKAEVLALHG